ncbi:MAG TPA: translation elongation factor Ts [Candidatus Polarisedimenticolaceae bacterium]|nr:translation elongation factor Ts [Candidatus Polarisedimenticolaceae bacterium]
MEVSAAAVKNLREKTGAGMMDCKKALAESGGDLDKAVDYLRQKGLAAATKKASRTASDGAIGAYVHPGGKIGVLVELNCETDFVARTAEFQNLLKDIAMQIAAANPRYIRAEEVPSGHLEKEKEIYRRQALESGKPEKVVEKVVDGKIDRFYSEVCLLEQSFIKNPDQKVSDILTEAIARLGENIQVKRFSRYQLGEGAPQE